MDENKDALSQSDQTEEKEPSDQLTPEHPRFKQVIEKLHERDETIDTLRKELDEVKQRIETRQDKTGDNELTDDERQALNKIKLNLKDEYVRKEDLEEERRINKMSMQFERLTDRFDGKNGYPKFVAADVAAFAAKRGHNDMEAAYRDMHFDAIVGVEAKKLQQKPTAPVSEKPTGSTHSAPETDLTAEQIANMSDEDYEKHRSKILSAVKATTKQ